MKIHEVNVDTILTVVSYYEYEDEYGSSRTSSSKKDIEAPKDTWGYYIVDSSKSEPKFTRLTPAFKIVPGYKNCVKFVNFKYTEIVGDIDLGTLDVDVEYDEDVLHFSELNLFDKFVFEPNTTLYQVIGREAIRHVASEEEYVFIQCDPHQFQYASMDGKLITLTICSNTNQHIFVKRTGKASFK